MFGTVGCSARRASDHWIRIDCGVRACGTRGTVHWDNWLILDLSCIWTSEWFPQRGGVRFGNRALRALRGSFRTYIGTKIYIHNMYWYFDIVAMFSKCFLVIEFCIVSVHQIYTKVHTSFFGTLVRNVQYSRKFAYLLPSRSRNVQLAERTWIVLITIIKGMILTEVYNHFGFQDSFIFYAWWM